MKNQMTARLVPLGTNSLIPSFGRQTLSFLYSIEKSLLLLDAGTGIGRLVEPTVKDFVGDYSALNIILSNYSYDRLVGLTCLSQIWKRPVVIYAPGPPLVDKDPKQILSQLLRSPLIPSDLLSADHMRIVVVSEQSLKLKDLDINFLPQKAPGSSIGIRLGDSVAYLPEFDTAASASSFIEGCEFLLSRIALEQIDFSSGAWNLRSNPLLREVISIALKARNKVVMPINLLPDLTEDEVSRVAYALRTEGLIGIDPLEGSILRI